jgi:hypothetical protein
MDDQRTDRTSSSVATQPVANVELREAIFGYVVVAVVGGWIMLLLMDTFSPGWDIFIRVKWPKYTTGSRYIAGLILIAAAFTQIASPILPIVLIVLAAAALPFIWLIALSRRKK